MIPSKLENIQATHIVFSKSWIYEWFSMRSWKLQKATSSLHMVLQWSACMGQQHRQPLLWRLYTSHLGLHSTSSKWSTFPKPKVKSKEIKWAREMWSQNIAYVTCEITVCLHHVHFSTTYMEIFSLRIAKANKGGVNVALTKCQNHFSNFLKMLCIRWELGE